MKLLKNSTVQILLPSDPTLREQFAADELKKYLQQIFCEINIDPTSDVTFVIGGPGRNDAAAELISKEEFFNLLTGEEGILIRICGNKVLIAGSEGFEDRERGTVYAVYEFLERYLGCSLASYCAPEVDAGEYVPILEELELEDSQYVKEGSDRPYRCAIVEYGDHAGNPDHGLNTPFLDWLVKNRYNRILTWCKIYEGWKKLGLVEEIERRGLRLSVGHHDSVRQWLPFDGNDYFPEKYAETHPEYYRLNLDGTRFRPKHEDDPDGQWVFCSRNEACIEQLSQNIIKWINDNPVVDIIALWPMDGRFDQCCCPACAQYDIVENYAYFMNEVAKRVAMVHPLIKMDLLIYATLWECPETLELSSSLFCDKSTWAPFGLRPCGKPDGSCLADTRYTDTLLKWRKCGSEVAFYDYYMSVFGARQRIVPMADELQSLWKYYRENDVMGSGTQFECFNVWNYLVNLYCFARTGYDCSLSMQDNLDRLNRIFGEGAPYINKIIVYLEEINDGQVDLRTAADYLMQHIDIDQVYDWFEQAYSVASTPLFRNNIRMLRMAFRYSDLEYHDSCHKVSSVWLMDYEDATGELAYMSINYDSFVHNKVGYGIDFPVANKDTKGFQPDKWYLFE